MSPTRTAAYRFGVAIGLAIGGIMVLGWQAVQHEPYRRIYAELSGDAAVLPLVTTVTLSLGYRVGVPLGLLLAVLLAHRRSSLAVAGMIAVAAWLAVGVAHVGATAPLRMLSNPIQGP